MYCVIVFSSLFPLCRRSELQCSFCGALCWLSAPICDDCTIISPLNCCHLWSISPGSPLRLDLHNPSSCVILFTRSPARIKTGKKKQSWFVSCKGEISKLLQNAGSLFYSCDLTPPYTLPTRLLIKKNTRASVLFLHFADTRQQLLYITWIIINSLQQEKMCCVFLNLPTLSVSPLFL